MCYASWLKILQTCAFTHTLSVNEFSDCFCTLCMQFAVNAKVCYLRREKLEIIC